MADVNIANVKILTTFSDATTREYIISGENLPTVLGKISKFMKTSAGEITGDNFAEVFNDYANNSAFGNYSHAEGSHTIAFGNYSHSEGNSTSANGEASHTEGTGTTAGSSNQHVQGKYNVVDSSGAYAFIIGNGNSANDRSNAIAIDWDGKIYPNNSVTGYDLSEIAEREILYNTTAEWNKYPSLVGKKDTVYVYTDYKTIGNTTIPGFKIGNGNVYLVDLPFVTDWIKPSIIQADTTTNWNKKSSYVPETNCICIYTDYKTINDVNIPGVKIGNGNVYITDLPFITDWITPGLVTDEERTFWNNKVTAYIDHTNDESLVLSKLAEPTS